jgi:DNA-binding MarR family transcriptional regulator
MQLELQELFPKQSELRLQGVQLLMRLEEAGQMKQSKLITELDLDPYAVSRLLTKLELHQYVTRERTGTDKMVTLAQSSQLET